MNNVFCAHCGQVQPAQIHSPAPGWRQVQCMGCQRVRVITEGLEFTYPGADAGRSDFARMVDDAIEAARLPAKTFLGGMGSVLEIWP